MAWIAVFGSACSQAAGQEVDDKLISSPDAGSWIAPSSSPGGQTISGESPGTFGAGLGAGGAGGEGAIGGAGGNGGTGGAEGDGGVSLPQSLFCGDAVRGLDEECDAGETGGHACTAACEVLDYLLIHPTSSEPTLPLPAGRVLGTGRHPSAATEDALAVAFIEQDDPVAVKVQLLDALGNRTALIDGSEGTHPISSANPVVAGLPDGTFILAFNDFYGPAGLGVALRHLDPTTPTLGPVVRANQTNLGPQFDPDIITVDSGEVVVAWTDTSAPLAPKVVARLFNSQLQASGDEVVLGDSSLPEGNVALTRFGVGWAAAFREEQEDGSEEVVVFTDGTRWRIPVAQPGPATDRPAIIALDSAHLLVVHTAGTDPLNTGVSDTPRLYAAVVDTVGDVVYASQPIEPLDATYAGPGLDQLSIGQSQPSAVVVGERFYVSWRSDRPLSDSRGSELWLKQLEWDPTSQELSLGEPEILLQRWEEHTFGDQSFPALAPTPLAPEGALLLAWEDAGLSLDPGQGRPDVVTQLAPVPILRQPPAPNLLIDDLEDNDDWIVPVEGRVGRWFSFNDETPGGTQSPLPEVGNFVPDAPGHDSNYAARTTGNGFTSWGAGLALRLKDDGSGKQTYDASLSRGLTFWARAGTTTNLRFNVSDANTDPVGGICTTCFDYFGADVVLTTSWQQYSFTWGQLAQQGWGDAFGALDADTLVEILFQVGPNETFDIWVDDVAFIPPWSTELIDDLEDGDGEVIETSGRQGTWFSYNDESLGGTQTPSPLLSAFPPDSPGFESTYAARTYGSGFTIWGAGLAAELNAGAAYDASAYEGITFYARAAASLPVRFMISDANTAPEGGVCSACFDHFGRDITLGSDWQKFSITWQELSQQGWGDAFSALDTAHIYTVYFQMLPGTTFDLWVDDLGFISEGSE